MGIAVVLIFYAIGLTLAASVCAMVLGVVTRAVTKGSGPKRKRAVMAAIFFPFACVAFAGVWFIGYAAINYDFFDRDPGLGDSWETPLPNGYALMMIDTTDQGTVYNPRTQMSKGSVMSKDDAVFGVRQLQVANNLIFGARDSGYFDRIGKDSKVVDAYFELDTSKKTHTEFKTIEELRQQAARESVSLNLREFESVFGDYRNTWFDYLAFGILLLVPAAGFVLLTRWIWKMRLPA